MLYQQQQTMLGALHSFPSVGSYLIGSGSCCVPQQPLPSTSPSATSGSTEPLQQLYDEMYNLDFPSPLLTHTLPGTFSPLPPSSPTPNSSLGVSHSAASRRFSYPNSPVHMGVSVTNGPQQSQTDQKNLPQITAEPTSNIAAVVAAEEQALSSSKEQSKEQISKHLQQLRLHHHQEQGPMGSVTAPAASSSVSTPGNTQSLFGNNTASSIATSNQSSSSPPSSSASTVAIGRNNSIPSFSKCFKNNSSIDSISSTTSFNTGQVSKFSERAAAAKNRWKAKGSITQGHVPQRQSQAASNGSASALSSGTNNINNLQTPQTNLAHSHSFDDAFENGKVVTSSSGSAQLLHRRHTHHR